MEEFQALAEVTEEIHFTKLDQEVGNLIHLGVLGLPYVGIKVPHHDGALLPELDQGLLQV